ncbi:MAG TPA: glycosyltransferase [Flavobacterium sp.]|nr:glycosyltransferase [Flavobacterium sp.]
MKKISIIVPVYKVEAYIEKCLKSLLEQDLPKDEYEIIFINDGSPDNSNAIIEKYQKENSNIILVNQENQGVSVARNEGIEMALGEYIFFVDSDDSLYPNVLKTLYEQCKRDNLDLLYVRMIYFDDNGNNTGEFVMEDPEIKIADGFNHYRRGFIFSLYKREMIKNIRFTPGIPIGEDALFNLWVHVIARRVTYSELPVYKYLIREGSALKSDLRFSDKAFYGYLKMIQLVKDYFETHKPQYTAEQIKYFDRPFMRVIELPIMSSIIPTRSVTRLRQLKALVKKNNLDYLNAEISKKFKYFDRHWTIFIAYHALQALLNKRK